jgi:chromosome segregation ATPase
MDAGEDGRWMTFTELADFRGIDRQSARRLASRQKWRRQKDNQGIVRVYVPLTLVERRAASADMSADVSADTSADMPGAISTLESATADMSRAINTLEVAISALREQLDQSNQQLSRAETRADRAEQGRDAERSRADALRDQIEALRVQLADRQDVVDASEAIRQADERRRALGRWARIRQAWRGE